MNFKVVFLFLMTISMIPAVTNAFADPTSTNFRVVVTDNELFGDLGGGGGVLMVNPFTISESTSNQVALNSAGAFAVVNDVAIENGNILLVDDNLDTTSRTNGLWRIHLTPYGTIDKSIFTDGIEHLADDFGGEGDSAFFSLAYHAPTNNAYVLDIDTSKIYEFDLDDPTRPIPATQIPSHPDFSFPVDLTIDSNGRLVIVGSFNNDGTPNEFHGQILSMERDGSSPTLDFLGTPLQSLEGANGIDIIGTNLAYVASSVVGVIEVDLSGPSYTIISPEGGNMNEAFGIAIDESPTTDDIYISDTSAFDTGSVKGAIFRLPLTTPPITPIEESSATQFHEIAGIDVFTLAAIPPPVLLEVTKTGPTQVQIVDPENDPIQYTVTGTNIGTIPVDDLVIADNMPNDANGSVEVVDVTVNAEIDGTTYSDLTNVLPVPVDCNITQFSVTCDYSDWLADQSLTFDTDDFGEIIINGKILLGATGPLNNEGLVQGGGVSENVFFETNILGLSVLKLTSSVSPNPAIAGEENIVFTIKVDNEGPNTATALALTTDTLPADVTFVSGSSSVGGTCSESSGIITCNLPNLNVNDIDDVTINLSTKVSATSFTSNILVDCIECGSGFPDSISPVLEHHPVLTSISDQTMDVGKTLVVPISATDSDGDDIILTTTGLPPFGVLTDSGGGIGFITFDPEPGEEIDSPFTISVIATDDSSLLLAATETFDLSVIPNNAPTISEIDDQIVSIGSSIIVSFTYSDLDSEDILTFTDTFDQTWINLFDLGNGNGEIIINPPVGTPEQVFGSYFVTITDDGIPPLSDSTEFLITVTEGEQLFCDRPISSFDEVIYGTEGNDKNLKGTMGDDLIFGLGGNDYIKGFKGDDCIFGGDGNDKIHGHSGDDIIFGENGNDRIYGNNGNDEISGGDGQDKIRGNNGHDRVSGGEGKDHIRGGNGDDSLSGDSGNDNIHGGNGDDFINGGEDYDYCKGGSGTNEIIHCEAGDSKSDNNDKKVYVCHDDEKLKINQSQLQEHLDHGDEEGKCNDKDDNKDKKDKKDKDD